MNLNPPQDYEIQLLDGGSYRLCVSGKVCTFTKPASVRGVAKLYTLSEGTSLLYVGIAEQPLSSRLNFGFKATGKGGYHGYKWKELRRPLALSVWTARVGEHPASLREMETVEAEVVFCCRQESGQWPSHQHEIHFYLSRPEHRATARTIYRHVLYRSAISTTPSPP